MLKAGNGGTLRNFATGEDLTASFTMVVESGATDDFGEDAAPNAGSPAYKLFNGKVDLSNSGIPGVRASSSTRLVLSFSGLDPSKLYKFRGTSIRGGGYNDRWSVFTLLETDTYVAAHEDGSPNKNIITKATFPAADLQPNQVALNTGDNKVGSLVGWDNIQPTPDGTFSIAQEQWMGATPFGNTAAAAVKYGYAFGAIYLAEVESTGLLKITENPASQKRPAGATATFAVVATSPQAISYQWQRVPSWAVDYLDIPGATSASYTTPPLTLFDDGSSYRCVVKSGPNTTTTSEALLGVDGVPPRVIAAQGSIEFNSVYIGFSEPMNLEQLANPDNYKIDGGLVVTEAHVVDPSTVHLVTSPQTPSSAYTVTINGQQDVAGNPLAAATTVGFTAFDTRAETVGLDLWFGFAGGTVASLRNDARYPAGFDIDYTLGTLDSTILLPSGPNNAYAGRFRAWVTPAETGDYEFFLNADEVAELRVSVNDETFDNIDSPDITPDAVDTNTNNTFDETGSRATSAPITLVAGQRYPLQVIWVEVNGADYCKVAWRRVGDPTPASELPTIPSQFLSYYGPKPARINSITLGEEKVLIEWIGSALETSDDLQSWSEVKGAASPLAVVPKGHSFYRARK